MTLISACSICKHEIPKENLRVSKNVFLCSSHCKMYFLNLLGFSSSSLKVSNDIRHKTKEILDKKTADQWAKLAKSMLTRSW